MKFANTGSPRSCSPSPVRSRSTFARRDIPSRIAERTFRRERHLMRLLTPILLLTTFTGSLLHAASGPKIKHVLVISIDGMYSQDLVKWVAANPGSTLAALSKTGVNYTNAYTTQPSDS